MRNWSSLALAAAFLPSASGALELSSPAACAVGETCQVMQVVDRDPGPGHADFTCGSLSYDGHRGVDIGLPSWAAMQLGTDVLAAAPGRVRGMRDGMEDRAGYRAPIGDIEGRECGNGVVIDHGDGWQTQYCHMMRGSVAVQSGDQVSRGQVLGRIGASGQADFPHVHLVVRKDGDVIDPYDGQDASDSCETEGGRTLWSDGAIPALRPGGILSGGFRDGVPDYAEVWNTAASADQIPPHGGAMVYWAHFYGLREGDALTIRITGPDGTELVSGTHIMDRNRATEFRAVGRRTPAGGWPPGTYAATAELLRDAQVIDERMGETTVP